MYFLKADEDYELFIMADVRKNASFFIEDYIIYIIYMDIIKS